MGSPATDVPKSTPGHGGSRPGAGRKPNVGGRPPKTEQNDAYTLIAKAKAKHETYKAQLAELEYKRQIGELLPAAEVAEEWSNQIRIAKERLLSLPARLAPKVVRQTEMREVEKLIREAIHDVLSELANGE
jgi:hypothetical protein